MHDAIELEARGVPTAAIVTEVFAHEARVQRDALGMAGLEPVVIEHPLSTLTAEQLAARVDTAVAPVRAWWLGG